MAKIVLGVAIVLMLATAFFGFETKSKVVALNDDLKKTTEQKTVAEGTARKAKDDAKAAQDELATEKQKADAAAAELATAKTEGQSAKDQAKDLQTKLDAATAQVEELNKKIGEGPTGAPVAGGPSDEVTKLQAELKDAQAKVASLQGDKAAMESKAKAADAEASDLRQKEQRRQSGLMRPGIEGQVLAVNPGWNFVVLSLGDRQGAVMNAEMIVVRGDTRIAKVRITSVEPSTSVADVVPGSEARGARIQPGDRVIFPGG